MERGIFEACLSGALASNAVYGLLGQAGEVIPYFAASKITV